MAEFTRSIVAQVCAFGIIMILPIIWQVEGALVKNAINKRMALRSSDPLTRRSAGEKHFIRFGRNANDETERTRTQRQHPLTEHNQHVIKRTFFNKREAFFDDTTISIGENEAKNPNTYAKWNALPLTSNSRSRNTSRSDILDSRRSFNVNNECYGYIGYCDRASDDDHDEDDNDDDSEEKKTAGLKIADVGDQHNFSKGSRSKIDRNLFDRHDRGRDNFMRLGRSGIRADEREERGRYQDDERLVNGISEHSKQQREQRVLSGAYDNFIRLGEGKIWIKKHDSNFMRLGRQTNTAFDNDSEGSFLRYVRGNDLGLHNDHDRLPRKNSNFIRLGRDRTYGRNEKFSSNSIHGNEVDDKTNAAYIKRTDTSRSGRASNFIRLGRGFTDMRLLNANSAWPSNQAPEHLTKRKLDSFVRFGRPLPSFTAKLRHEKDVWNYHKHDSIRKSRQDCKMIEFIAKANTDSTPSVRYLNKYSRFCSYAAVCNRSAPGTENLKLFNFECRPFLFANETDKREEKENENENSKRLKDNEDEGEYEAEASISAYDHAWRTDSLTSMKSLPNTQGKHFTMRRFLKTQMPRNSRPSRPWLAVESTIDDRSSPF